MGEPCKSWLMATSLAWRMNAQSSAGLRLGHDIERVCGLRRHLFPG